MEECEPLRGTGIKACVVFERASTGVILDWDVLEEQKILLDGELWPKMLILRQEKYHFDSSKRHNQREDRQHVGCMSI